MVFPSHTDLHFGHSLFITIKINHLFCISTKEGKDQESIQSSTTPEPGYQWASDNLTIRYHKREPRG